jgi:hypothetical protein
LNVSRRIASLSPVVLTVEAVKSKNENKIKNEEEKYLPSFGVKRGLKEASLASLGRNDTLLELEELFSFSGRVEERNEETPV